MKIMMQGRFALLAVLASAMIVSHATAQTTSNSSTLYLANAVPGRNVATAVTPGPGALPVQAQNPAFPLDVQVAGDDTCVAKGLSFGEIRSLTFVAGSTGLRFFQANAAAPCTGDVVFRAQLALEAGMSYIGVLTLDASGNLLGQIYTADLSPISAGNGRIEVANASQDSLLGSLMGSSGTATGGVGPGAVLETTAPAGLYTATWKADAPTVLVGPVNIQIEQGNSYLYVLTGMVSNNSIQFIGPAVIRGVL